MEIYLYVPFPYIPLPSLNYECGFSSCIVPFSILNNPVILGIKLSPDPVVWDFGLEILGKRRNSGEYSRSVIFAFTGYFGNI